MAYNYFYNTASQPMYSDTGGSLANYVGYSYQLPDKMGSVDYSHINQDYIAQNYGSGRYNQNEFDWGGTANNALSGVSAGLSAAQKYSAPKGQFEINEWGGITAGLEGSASGLSSGGPIGAVVGGVVGTIGSNVSQYNTVSDNIAKVSTDVQGYTTVDGRPRYLGGNIAGAYSAYDALKPAAEGDEWSLAYIFSPSSMAGPYEAANEAEDKQKKLQRSIKSTQNSYNDAVQSYNRRRRTQYEYERRSDPYRRLQNLY